MDDAEMTGELRRAIRPYEDLLRAFVSGGLAADAFEPAYTGRYLADESIQPPAVFDVVDGFFSDVDEFVIDPTLRAETGGIGPDELRLRAETLLRRAGLR